jgi:hypothetical protein
MLHGEPSFFSGGTGLTKAQYLAQFDVAQTAFKSPDDAFPKNLSPGAQRYGEKSPSYFTMPDEAIRRCAELLPRLKLICSIRNPVDRARSHLNRLKPQHRERVIHAARKGAASPELDAVIGQGRYREHLVRWARHFPLKQILLTDFDRLVSEPDALYDEILDFLHLPRLPAPLGLHRNGLGTSAQALPPDLERRLRAAYAEDDWSIVGLRRAMRAAVAPAPARRAEDLVPMA